MAPFPYLCGAALVLGEAIKKRREGEVQTRAEPLRGKGQTDLLSRIWDLTADGPESLEAVSDGMDVGHTHEHYLTVGVVL